MKRARLAAVPLAAVALAGCASITGGSTGHATPPASGQLTPPAACHYLHLDHDGEVQVPRIPALRHVVAHLARTAEGRAFRVIVAKVAADEAARSLAHWVRIGPDFAVLMGDCGGSGHTRHVPAGDA